MRQKVLWKACTFQNLETPILCRCPADRNRRVAIASAIASDKQVIVFDEPTSGLDYRHMKKVAENLRELSSLGKTLVYCYS